MSGDISQADIRIREFATPGLNCRLDGWIRSADFSSKVVAPPARKGAYSAHRMTPIRC